jgi:Tfp pilus assembly pilus retraction ATPase PilT
MTLFENICSPLINDLIENKKSGLIFAYGITNSGKTFTITGLNIKIKF